MKKLLLLSILIISFTYVGFSQVDDNPLPIELVSFDGRAKQETIELSWTTASEENNHFFGIEKRSEFSDFIEIGTVIGMGNSNASSVYNFVDFEPSNGKNLYRLVQYDYDGNFTYSNVISVSIVISTFKVSIYPNPTNSFLNVDLNTSLPIDAQISIYDTSSKLLFKKTLVYTNGQMNTNVDINSLKGERIVIVTVTQGDDSHTAKIVLN